jgi:hypothetical protein
MRCETAEVVSEVSRRLLENRGIILESSDLHAIACMVDKAICSAVVLSVGMTPHQREEFCRRGIGLTEID